MGPEGHTHKTNYSTRFTTGIDIRWELADAKNIHINYYHHSAETYVTDKRPVIFYGMGGADMREWGALQILGTLW